ncbi:MAG: hypothetical protein GF408_05675 [Candidatus Omnitrophica bacterium]|nr:hypothetical protein [Candidatus Omnitrophota bacterium]
MLQLLLSSFLLSIVFTFSAIYVAKKKAILDRPSERKIHEKPVPLLGGVAVFSAFAAALLLNFRFSAELKGVCIASFFIMVSGLLDDLKDTSASFRLLVQVLCALVVVKSGVFLRIIPADIPFQYLIEVIVTVVWIVGITNAVNFMDGADGLAAGMACIVSATFFGIAYFTGQVYFSFINLALLGACLGFLVFNKRPARIFLGDAGSSFLGFSLGVFAVMGEWAENKPIVALSIPLIVLAIPIFDVIYITVARIGRGKVKTFRQWIEYVGKDHLHHRLMSLGFSQGQTVFFILSLNAALALGALVLKGASTYQAVLLLLQCASFLLIVTVLMLAGRNMGEKNGVNASPSERAPGE